MRNTLLLHVGPFRLAIGRLFFQNECNKFNYKGFYLSSDPKKYLSFEIAFLGCKAQNLTYIHNVDMTVASLYKVNIFEPWHWISNNVVCATNKSSDQPAHMRSLIIAVGSRLNTLRVFKLQTHSEHHLELLSLKGGCTGSSESTIVKMPYCWKSHVTAHM